MATKKKKSGRGGARKGAGRKETGKTTNTVCFSVPIGQEENIKTLVKAKLGELKGGAKIQVQDLTQPTNEVKPITDAPKKSNYVAKQPYVSDAIRKKRGW